MSARLALAPASEEAPRLGPKGMRTRRRIMDATLELLRERAFHELRVTDIARAADIAQPNFYTYFDTLEDLVFELAQEVSMNHLATFVREGGTGSDWAERMVQSALPYWQENGELFGIVSALADKQHGRFAELRVRQTRKVYKAIESLIRQGQAAGRLPAEIEPRLGGYLCFFVIASMCVRYDLLRASGFTHDQIITTTASMLRMMASGTADTGATA
jgi:AcrR family transcriptional regulator